MRKLLVSLLLCMIVVLSNGIPWIAKGETAYKGIIAEYDNFAVEYSILNEWENNYIAQVTNYFDIIKKSPESSSALTLPISIAIPVGDYVSFDLLSITIPGGVKTTLSKINNSPYENKCHWKFSSHYDADIDNNDALTTETGYGGYIKYTFEDSGTNTYDVITEGTIYYEITTQLVNYLYDGAFNVDLSRKVTITNEKNN